MPKIRKAEAVAIAIDMQQARQPPTARGPEIASELRRHGLVNERGNWSAEAAEALYNWLHG